LTIDENLVDIDFSEKKEEEDFFFNFRNFFKVKINVIEEEKESLLFSNAKEGNNPSSDTDRDTPTNTNYIYSCPVVDNSGTIVKPEIK